MKCFSRTQILLWKQMISIHRIQFQILLQLTWRGCCCCLNNIITNMRITGGKICGLWTLLLNTNRQPFPMKKPFKLLNHRRTGLERTFNSMSNSEFWIRMKNEYPDLHEIAIRFLLCFPTTYLCETAFCAMTVLKTKQRNPLQLSDCLRLAITSIHPTINTLTYRKQQQKSHQPN